MICMCDEWASVTESCLDGCMSSKSNIPVWSKVSTMPPHSKKKQDTRLNSVKIMINNSNVMHYMPFWIIYKTCNNTPDFREEEKKNFYAGSFSYTSQAAFIYMWGVSLTHPILASFYVGCFSYTSRAGLFSCEELLSSTVYSEDNPLRKELGGSWPRRKVWKSHTQTREGSPRTTWTEQNETK